MNSEFQIIAGTYTLYALATVAILAIRPTTRRALACLSFGWLFLPVEAYPADTITAHGFTFEVLGTVLPGRVLMTKTWIAPLSVLAGLVVGARGWPGTYRFSFADLGIAAFCLSPGLAALVDRSDGLHALLQSAYLFAVWGSSWLIGRMLLCGDAGRATFVRALRSSGLALLPVALLEAVRPAWLYELVYGAHPFIYDGNVRYLGFRPLGFFEDGNQYGIWMAMAALAAVSLCIRPDRRAPSDMLVAAVLVLASVASQSVGAIILLGAGIGWLMLRRSLRQVMVVAAIATAVIGAPLYLSGKLPLEHWAKSSQLGQTLVAHVRASGRGSLVWRVKRDQVALPVIFRAGLTGYGKWDWWRSLQSHPWGLPLLLAGQFGLPALFVIVVTLVAGAVRRLLQGRSSVLSLIVILAAIDAGMNSFVFLPMIVVAGGLAVSARPTRPRTAWPDEESDTRGDDILAA